MSSMVMLTVGMARAKRKGGEMKVEVEVVQGALRCVALETLSCVTIWARGALSVLPAERRVEGRERVAVTGQGSKSFREGLGHQGRAVKNMSSSGRGD